MADGHRPRSDEGAGFARATTVPPLAKAKRSAPEGRPPYQFIARTGYLARGLVYAIVGLVALSVAAGTRKNALSLTDALQELLQRPSDFLSSAA